MLRSVGRDHRSPAHQDLARFRALQAGHAGAPDRAAHGAGRINDMAGISICCGRIRRDRAPRQGPADQRHQLLPRPKAFEFLAEKVIPELVRRQPSDRPLRIWVAGCSTGEETYSIAMLFLEEIAAAKRNIKLQVFASDVDDDAVAIARNGLYPESIAADVSPARLARFFTKEDHGYRVVPELRGAVVFTVQDVLADPPFSRLDLVSCRNLLIYLRPEAQAEGSSAVPFRTAARAASCFSAPPRRWATSTTGSSRSPRRSGSSADRPQPARGSRFSDRLGRGRASDLAGSNAPGGDARASALAISRSGCWSRPMRRLRF